MTATDSKITFIIGAGASFEFNLPLGPQLKNDIRNLIAFERNDFGDIIAASSEVTQAIKLDSQKKKQKTTNDYYDAIALIRQALPLAISIDNLLDSHKGNYFVEFVGKLAIAIRILGGERNSTIMYNLISPQEPDFSQFENSWLVGFFKLLTENSSAENVKERFSQFSLIIFNYDRVVETFLHFALKSYYNIDDEKVKEIIKCMTIIHPYGAIGEAEWKGKTNRYGFGNHQNIEDLCDSSARIKTFSEGFFENAKTSNEVHAAIQGSKLIGFLGFAFHEINMNALFPSHLSGTLGNLERIVATAFKVSEIDCEVIKNNLANLCAISSSSIAIDSKITCDQLFFQYGKILSMYRS